MNEVHLVFWQLILYGIHLGHSFKNSTFYAGWLIFTFNVNIYMINLYKTILGFRNSFVGFDFSCKVGIPVWFINLNRAFELYVNESALKCGEFAYTTYWIHGMVSNFISLAQTMSHLSRYTEDAWKGQFAKLDMSACPWYFSRWSWPRSACISSVSTTEWPSKECLTSRIPSMGICDTSISGHISNIATPGNDDSLDSQIYYNTFVSQYILGKKFSYVAGWLHHIRNYSRFLSFSEWVLQYFILYGGAYNPELAPKSKEAREMKRQITDETLYYVTNHRYSWVLLGESVKFFYASGSGDDQFYASLDLYEPFDINKDIYDYIHLQGRLKQRSFFICRTMNFYMLKGLWHISNNRVIRMKFKSYKFFKTRFLAKVYKDKKWDDDYFDTNFLINRFWRNRIFKTYIRKRKYRKNIFVQKYFKFFLIYRYSNVRGFMDADARSFLKVSNFARVAFNYSLNRYKNKHYSSIYARDIYNERLKHRHNFFFRLLNFKKNAKQFLSKVVFHGKKPANYVYSQILRVYGVLKEALKYRYHDMYAYFSFYFCFWFWSRAKKKYVYRQRNWQLLRIFRSLKNLNKLVNYLNLFKSTFYPFRFFNHMYLFFSKKNKVYHDSLNLSFSRFFRMISWGPRRLYYARFLRWRFQRIRSIKKYFKKLIKIERSNHSHNKMLDTLNYVHRKFKRTKKVQDKVRRMHRAVNKNVYINYYIEGKKNKYKPLRFNNYIKAYRWVSKKLLRMAGLYRLKYRADWRFVDNRTYPQLEYAFNLNEAKKKIMLNLDRFEAKNDSYHQEFNKFMNLFSRSDNILNTYKMKHDVLFYAKKFIMNKLSSLAKRFSEMSKKKPDYHLIRTYRKSLKNSSDRLAFTLLNGVFWLGYKPLNMWAFMKKYYFNYTGLYVRMRKKLILSKNYLKKRRRKVWRNFWHRSLDNKNLDTGMQHKFLFLPSSGLKFFYYFYYFKHVTIFQKYYSFYRGAYMFKGGQSYSRKHATYVFWL